jgi:hypothetical protein
LIIQLIAKVDLRLIDIIPDQTTRLTCGKVINIVAIALRNPFDEVSLIKHLHKLNGSAIITCLMFIVHHLVLPLHDSTGQ